MSYGVYDFDGRDSHPSPANPRHSPTADLCDHGLLPQGPVRSAVELRHRLRLDVQQRLGHVRQRPDAGTMARPDRIRPERLQRLRLVGRLARSRLRANRSTTSSSSTTRALSQVNLFWHHKFCSGADSWVWVGVPDHGRYDERQELRRLDDRRQRAGAAVGSAGPVRQRQLPPSQRCRGRRSPRLSKAMT